MFFINIQENDRTFHLHQFEEPPAVIRSTIEGDMRDEVGLFLLMMTTNGAFRSEEEALSFHRRGIGRGLQELHRPQTDNPNFLPFVSFFS